MTAHHCTSKTFRYLMAALLAALPAWVLVGDAPAQTKAAPKKQNGIMLISRDRPDEAAVERGKGLYDANCSFCHGANATGASGPDLVRSELALDDDRGNRIGPLIKRGRGAMPAFADLTNEQILDLAAFLRSRQISAIDRNEYEIQDVATGDLERGKEYFNGAGGCTACHSVTGDLAGVAKKYEEEPYILQVRFLNPRTTKPTLVTVTEPSGDSVTGRLLEIDDFEVTLRDSTGARLTIARGPNVKVDVQHPLARHRELLKTYTDDIIHDVMAYLVTLK